MGMVAKRTGRRCLMMTLPITMSKNKTINCKSNRKQRRLYHPLRKELRINREIILLKSLRLLISGMRSKRTRMMSLTMTMIVATITVMKMTMPKRIPALK